MSDITQEGFASAVAATIASVHHLYREVARLNVELREALSEEPGALISVRGSSFGKPRVNPTRFVIRDAYGVLFKPVVSDEEMDTAEDDEEEPDIETDSGGTRSRPVELVADQPLLAVRVVLYDPRKLGRDDEVEPQIQFGVMSDWKVDSDEATDGQQFTLDRSMLRRVPLSLGAGVGTGHASRLQTTASVKSVKHVVGAKHKKIKKNRKLSCQLPVGVETEPLYSLDSPEELNKLVGRIRTMWWDNSNTKPTSDWKAQPHR